MYNQLIALVTKYQTAIAKLEALNVADTAEILTMIAQRRTAETRYNVLRINRAILGRAEPQVQQIARPLLLDLPVDVVEQ